MLDQPSAPLDPRLATPEASGDAAVITGPAPGTPSPWPWRWRWIRRGLAALLLLFILIFAWLAVTAPLSKSLAPIAPPRLTLLAADGQPIARNGAIVDKPVKVALLPVHVKQAFIAIEDRRFYSHWGIDPRGLVRAAWNNLGSGGTQGGSTITQQLAKVTFLTPERSMTRKAREMLIAFWLEGWLTKDEILERYLSNVYFGDNVYGLRAASLHYFYRQPENLTLSQATMLAGMVQAPSRLAPTRNLTAARTRAKRVLAAMVDVGFVSPAKAATTRPADIDVRGHAELPTGTYFADWAMPKARALTGEAYGSEQVKTTLDARLQRIARGVINAAPLGKAQVALVAMRPNGEVVAMLGGRDYRRSPFNRATQARRQPGSTFKLFVYLAALRSGMTPDSVIDGSAFTGGAYQPKNSGGTYQGQITLRQAFARSSNVAAVRLYRQVGDKAVIRAARDLGIRSPLTADPSLALGSSGVTLLELTSAYAAVAANRWPVAPRAMPADEPGFFADILSSERSFDGDTHAMLLDLLSATVTQGTARGAQLAIKSYGKTGTSQDNRDALFIGFAGDLIVGVWVGNDDNSPLKGVNGGGLPTRIWRDFMGAAIEGARPALQPKPDPKPEPDMPGDSIDIPNIPIKIDDSHVQLGNDSSVTLNTDIGGVKFDVKLGKDGFDINPSSPPKRER
jgi:penicillin-binding protein 1A